MVRLRSALREALEDFRKESPSLSLRSIAARSGVNRYFLTKLLQSSEDEDPSLDLGQVLKLSHFLSIGSGARDAGNPNGGSFEKLRKSIWDAFGTILPNPMAMPPQMLQQQVDLFNVHTYFSLVLATCKGGTPRIAIEELLGAPGKRALEELLQSELVKETQEGRICLTHGEDFSSSLPLLFHHVPNYLRYYKLHKAGQGRNRFHVHFESLNLAAFKAIFKLHDRMAREVAKIITDPKSIGDIPFFSLAFFDSFLEEIPKG